MKQNSIVNLLYTAADGVYKDFNSSLITTVDKKRFIGVQTPKLRAIAHNIVKSGDWSDFIADLPHYFFEENQLHAFIVSEIRDFDFVIAAVDKFLPYVDNWATCDQMSPKVFVKNAEKTLPYIKKWIKSKHVYTVRFRGTVGPGPGAGYGSLVLLADLLIGEKLENNLFLQDVYWGLGNKFAKDFDKTVQTSQVKFTDYLKPFVICGTPEDNLKSDDLLHGAIEYNLKKATSTQEIDQVYKFQEKILTFYRDGFISTGIVEDQDIERMNNLIQFANKMHKKSKLDILNKKAKSTGNTPSARTTTRTI